VICRTLAGNYDVDAAQVCDRLRSFRVKPILDAPLGYTDPAPADAPFDAAKQGNTVHLKTMSGRHAFIEGKPTGTNGYSAPILGPLKD
jgi:hypothetical protein